MSGDDAGRHAASIGRVRDYWEERARRAETDCEKIESGRRAQCMRFEAFVIQHELRGKSILDVGCGVGDFWQHLQRRGVDYRYLGVDIAPAMVQRARERFPGTPFECRNILERRPDRQFDYCVAFGIHANVRLDRGRELLEAVTRRQFELCRVAAHVTALTDRYHGFAPHVQAWRAEEVLSMALDITPCLVLRHDYLPNDFSVTLYRKLLIDTNRNLLLD